MPPPARHTRAREPARTDETVALMPGATGRSRPWPSPGENSELNLEVVERGDHDADSMHVLAPSGPIGRYDSFATPVEMTRRRNSHCVCTVPRFRRRSGALTAWTVDATRALPDAARWSREARAAVRRPGLLPPDLVGVSLDVLPRMAPVSRRHAPGRQRSAHGRACQGSLRPWVRPWGDEGCVRPRPCPGAPAAVGRRAARSAWISAR